MRWFFSAEASCTVRIADRAMPVGGAHLSASTSTVEQVMRHLTWLKRAASRRDTIQTSPDAKPKGTSEVS